MNKEKMEEMTGKALAWVKETAKKANEDLDKVEFLKKVESVTKVPKAAVVGAALLVILSLFLFNEGARFVVNVTSFVFPAYASFRSIENANGGESKLWLSYWIVMGALNLLDVFADWIIYWLPFYFLLKLGLVVYLWHPRTRGIKLVHDALIKYVPSAKKE